MTGRVTTDGEEVVHLSVLGRRGGRERIQAVIDTGYTGWLTLPPPLISRFRLRWRQLDRATLADGSIIYFDTFDATVLWDRRHRDIIVDQADVDSLVGMAMLEGYELNMQVRPGGKVSIKRL